MVFSERDLRMVEASTSKVALKIAGRGVDASANCLHVQGLGRGTHPGTRDY